MLNKFKQKIKKKIEISTLVSVIFITTITISYFNYFKKEIVKSDYNNLVDNIYLKNLFIKEQ